MDDPLAPHPDTLALDIAPDPALPALFGAAIGSLGAQRYPPLFANYETGERSSPSWNWAACLLTFNWMIFRRLWVPAGLYAATLLIVPLLLVGAGRLLLQWSDAVEAAALLGCATLAFALPALLGDHLLYRHCRHTITRALERTPTLEAACSTLAQHAPSRVWLQRQIMINLLVLGLGLLAAASYVAWPSTPATDDTDAAPMPIQTASKPTALASQPATAVAVATPAIALASAPLAPKVATAASAPASATEPIPAPAQAPASEPLAAARSVPVSITPAASPAIRVAVPSADKVVARDLPANSPVSTQPAKAYLINVGLFAEPDNARHAYVKLVKAGLPAQREVLLFKGQKVTRVRAGPFASRAKANAAVKKIKAMQLDAVLNVRG